MFAISYAFRNLARRKLRTAMGVLGVFCTLALLTAIQIGLDAISLSYIDLVSLAAGKADVVVKGEEGEWLESAPIDPRPVLEKLDADLRLRGFAPRVLGLARVGGGAEAYAVVVGLDLARERALGMDSLAPWPVLRPGECAFSEDLARRMGAGGKVAMDDIRGRGHGDFTPVRETIASQMLLPQMIKDYVVVDLAAAQALFGTGSRVHQLVASLREPRRFYDARDLHGSVQRLKDAGEEMAAALGREYNVTLPRAAAIAAFSDFSAPVRALFGIFALVALAITALLVHSIVSVSEEERVREHAILRTIGGRRRHVFGLVLTESGLLCLLGVVPGVLAGLVVARAVLGLVNLALEKKGAAIAVELTGGTFLLCLGAGVLVSFGSSLWPALRSTRRRIAASLDPLRRGEIIEPPSGERAFSRALLATGAALAAISTVTFFVLPSALLSGDPSLIGAVVLGLLVLLLIGFTLVALAVQPVMERAVLGALGWAFGPASELAGRNLARQRRRSTTTSLMFALSVSFVLFLASLVALFSRIASTFIEYRMGADIRISAGGAAEDGLAEDLRRVPGVEAVSAITLLRPRSLQGVAYDVVASDVVGMKRLWVVPFGVDPNLEEAFYGRYARFAAGDASAFARLAADGSTGRPGGSGAARVPAAVPPVPGAEPPPIIICLAMARHLGVSRGDLLDLTFQLGAQKRVGRFRIEAVAESMPGFHNFRAREGNAQGAGLLLSRRAFDEMTAGAPPQAYVTFFAVKGSVAAARTMRSTLALRYRLGVESTVEERRESEVLYWATQVLFALLLCLSVSIAVFGLVASTTSGVAERRREVAVLKAVGLRRGHLFRMFAAEAVVLTVSAGALGALIGYLVAYLFVTQTAVLIELPVVFTMPVLTLLATLGISVVAGLVAAVIATRGLLHKPVAEILRA